MKNSKTKIQKANDWNKLRTQFLYSVGRLEIICSCFTRVNGKWKSCAVYCHHYPNDLWMNQCDTGLNTILCIDKSLIEEHGHWMFCFLRHGFIWKKHIMREVIKDIGKRNIHSKNISESRITLTEWHINSKLLHRFIPSNKICKNRCEKIATNIWETAKYFNHNVLLCDVFRLYKNQRKYNKFCDKLSKRPAGLKVDSALWMILIDEWMRAHDSKTQYMTLPYKNIHLDHGLNFGIKKRKTKRKMKKKLWTEKTFEQTIVRGLIPRISFIAIIICLASPAIIAARV